MSTRKGTKGFLLGALAGGVIGSLTALLLAPKPGKELRQDISTGARKVGDSTVKAAGRVGEQTGRIAKGIGDQAIHLVDLTKQAAGNVVNSVKGTKKTVTNDESIGNFAIISGSATGVAAEAAAELGTEVVLDTASESEIATELSTVDESETNVDVVATTDDELALNTIESTDEVETEIEEKDQV
ncbi:YtxH domain-containing protein [Paenibacillus sp. GSMTC-2017]|uniref:YtxH domain-containing protein n=1 Tax=Paenibacillus sp. GSMTC-2017 TaxID=2794350 RepID=UPI0018D81395|nr:YtxH domain-containing protein [Paenibacillus sp. GSMTC-2017]MBH5318248.1 YtxH domain-containing protein [Paenibacillus sp. GSMTC-2017]